MSFKLFTLQGNIGSGKTTILKLFQEFKQKNVQILFEPVDQWQNIGQDKVNILQLFYQDSNKWAFPFQLYTLLTRFKKWKRAKLQDPNKTYLSERSGDADYHVFKRYMFQHNIIDKQQSQVYQSFYQSYLETMNVEPSKGVIYLKTSPENCFKRLKKRNRSEESCVPFQYLKSLGELHDEMMQTFEKANKPVLIIDGNKNFIDDDDIKQRCVEQISKFLTRL